MQLLRYHSTGFNEFDAGLLCLVVFRQCGVDASVTAVIGLESTALSSMLSPRKQSASPEAALRFRDLLEFLMERVI